MEKDVALQKFNAGYNCAQSVLFECSQSIGMDSNTAVKIATGFGGGMGRMQEVCGAVTGGIIAINYKFGRNENQEKPAQEKAYGLVRRLMTEFQKENGSCICRELLKTDLNTEEGRKKMKEGKLDAICQNCVCSAARIMEKILSENP